MAAISVDELVTRAGRSGRWADMPDALLRNLIWRFISFVVVDDATGCWNWQGSTRNGYGRFRVDGIGFRNQRAHRFSYEVFNGKLHAGMKALHQCDNKRCVNPDHLKEGTHQKNMEEAKERGRIKVGDDNPAAKLTSDQVREILQYRFPDAEELARKFGVSETAIREVISGKKWGAFGGGSKASSKWKDM